MEALQQLGEVVDAFQQQQQQDSVDAAAAEAELEPVLALALDPLIQSCEKSSEALRADSPSRCVWV